MPAQHGARPEYMSVAGLAADSDRHRRGHVAGVGATLSGNVTGPSPVPQMTTVSPGTAGARSEFS